LIGGYAGIISFMIAVVIGGYQEFAYERSLVGVLYKSKKNDDVNCNSEVNSPKK